MTLLRNETAHSINGVPGHLHTLHIPPAPWVPGVFANQTWTSERRPVKGYGRSATLQVEMRFDDNCRNGRMSFAITGSVVSLSGVGRAGGCLHEDIACTFPELAHLIRWHLTYTDGPMHYLGNTTYHASNLEAGKAEGEPNRWEKGFRFGNSPVTWRPRGGDKFVDWLTANRANGSFEIVTVEHDKEPGRYNYDPKYTFKGYGDKWHECPFDTLAQACEIAQAFKGEVHPVTTVTGYSKGKERNLDHARSCAVWPEATDEQLMAPEAELEAALTARLPALLAAFRADMEAAGFLWEAPTSKE